MNGKSALEYRIEAITFTTNITPTTVNKARYFFIRLWVVLTLEIIIKAKEDIHSELDA